MSPATDPGRAAEEMRDEIAYTMAMRTALRPSSVEGIAEWQRVGYSSPEQDARANAWKWYGAADALLAGPLAQLQADLIAARKERDEALKLRKEDRAWYEMTVSVVEEQRENYRAEAAQLRARLHEAEKGKTADLDTAMKRGIRSWSAKLHIPVTRMMSRVLREEIHAALTPAPEANQEAGDGA